MPKVNVEHEAIESQVIEEPFLKEACCEDFAFYFNNKVITIVDDCTADEMDNIRLHIPSGEYRVEIEFCPFCGEPIDLDKVEVEDADDGEQSEGEESEE